MLAKIREAATKSGETRSALMRQALRKYFYGEKIDVDISCLDPARDLAGSLEGPSDLSTNPAHLNGHGECSDPLNLP